MLPFLATFRFDQFESRKNFKWGYVCIIFFKVQGVRVEMKCRPSPEATG